MKCWLGRTGQGRSNTAPNENEEKVRQANGRRSLDPPSPRTSLSSLSAGILSPCAWSRDHGYYGYFSIYGGWNRGEVNGKETQKCGGMGINIHHRIRASSRAIVPSG